MTSSEMNIAICRALGVDPSAAVKVEILIEPGCAPKVTVHRKVSTIEAQSFSEVVGGIVADLGWRPDP